MSENKNSVAACLKAFPEILDHYSENELADSASLGAYIFFEDYFNEFVSAHRNSEVFFRRVAVFIEDMAGSTDNDLRNLAEIGILEGMVNRKVIGISKFLGPNSKHLIREASDRTKIDPKIWL